MSAASTGVWWIGFFRKYHDRQPKNLLLSRCHGRGKGIGERCGSEKCANKNIAGRVPASFKSCCLRFRRLSSRRCKHALHIEDKELRQSVGSQWMAADALVYVKIGFDIAFDNARPVGKNGDIPSHDG